MYEKADVKQRYNLPDEVRYCKKCVMSNQRPRIVFDDQGVCYACRFAEHKRTGIDWDERERELRDILDRYRRTDGGYDCIAPSSGGKDSAVVAHKLKYEYGMNPLTVTWAPHLYTEIGWRNFRALIDSGMDNVMAHPNGPVHRRMTREALIEVGDPFQSFVYGQVFYPLRAAVQHGVNLIFDGENGEAEYSGNPEAWDSSGFNISEYDDYWLSGFPLEHWLERGFTRRDLAAYTPPPREELAEKGVTLRFWSYFKKWAPQEHFYYASKHTGFEPNPDGRSEGTYSKYASLDDKIDGLHYYFMLLKFGIGRATSDASQEIRDGHLTREEAVALVRRYDTEFPAKHFQEALDYCGLTEMEFEEICGIWRNEHLWERRGNDWALKQQVE